MAAFRMRQLVGLGLLGAIGWAAVDVSQGRAAAALPGVSQAAVAAYVTAADYGNREHPGCGLDWHLLAGIGAVETGHGTFGDSELVAYVATPPIRGPQLDGGEFALIRDTDGGSLDGDPDYDRAVGPMQFIPGSWMQYRPGPDADPQDIRDSTKAAANLLCAVADRHGRPLSELAVEEAAVRSYNNSSEYVDAVRKFRDDFARVAPGGARGSAEVTPEAVAERLGREGRDRWAALGRIIDNAPGDHLDRVYDVVSPGVSVVWTTLDRDGADNAASLSASSAAGKIVAAAEAWVGRDYRPGVPAQCSFFVRQVLDEAGVTLEPVVSQQTLDQWASPGPGVANSYGGDQGAVIDRVEDLRAGDIIMFANTYGDWEEGSITHVGIVVEVNGPTAEQIIMVDRSTMAAPVKRRPISTFPKFVGAVRV